MTILAAGASASISLPAGQFIQVTGGSGVAQVLNMPGASPIVLDGDTKIGPFADARTVSLSATVAVDYTVTDGVTVGLSPSAAAAVQSALGGLGMPDYRTAVEQSISQALRLKSLTSAPAIVETAPTNKSSGNVYYIDNIAGLNANNGSTAAAPFKDAWKLPGTPGAGATIHLAADSVWEYAASWADYKAGRVDAANAFGANNVGQWTGTQANPITIRPYYPRGATASKPTIRWYALMQSGDWTQEAGINGGKVWSAAWAKSGNGYYNVGVAFGAARTMGVAWGQQNTSGAPGSLNAAGQFAVDATKVYVYVPDGTNPNTYYGEVRIFGGNGQALLSSFNGQCQNLRLFGIRFELCMPFNLVAGGTGNNADSIEVAGCDFVKTTSANFRHQQTFASPTEGTLVFRDNYGEDTHSAMIKFSSGGTAGNTVSWEFYRNRVNRGNLSTCYAGALFYNQCSGGTKHIAWGNYGFDCRTGYANEEIDGCFMYSDIGSDKAIYFGNIAEQCGKGFQQNNLTGMGVMVANLAIDCGSIGSITNTIGAVTAPSFIGVHNTYLWTGRISAASLPVGPNIGGSGVKDWMQEPALNITNQLALQSGATYNYVSLTLANNLFVNASGATLSQKPALRIPASRATTLLVAGNAPCGFASNAISEAEAFATSYTQSARYCHLVGGAGDAAAWLSQGATGVARPGVGSPLVGAGASLSVQYQDIGGRNFAAMPTIGCYEVSA